MSERMMLIIWCGGPDICHLCGTLWIIASFASAFQGQVVLE